MQEWIDTITVIVQSELVKSSVGSAVAWLKDCYRGHPSKAQENASKRAGDFLGILDTKIRELDCDEKELKEISKAALEDPEFTSRFQDALLTASKTDNTNKHHLLATLILERMQGDCESSHAIALKTAQASIPTLSSTQIQLLGFYYLMSNWGTVCQPSGTSDLATELKKAIEVNWAPYQELIVDITHDDTLHLDSLGLINVTGKWAGEGLATLMKPWNNFNKLTESELTELREQLINDLDRELKFLSLTEKCSRQLLPSGKIIGEIVFNQLKFK